MIRPKTPSSSRPFAFPVEVGGRELWLAWSDRGIIRHLFASSAAAEAEAKAYNKLDLTQRGYAADWLEIGSSGRFHLWAIDDLDDEIVLILSYEKKSIVKQTFQSLPQAAVHVADVEQRLNNEGSFQI